MNMTGQKDRIQLTKAYLEMDVNDSRNSSPCYGLMIDRGAPNVVLDANGLPDLSKWVGMNYVVLKGLIKLLDAQQLAIGSLTARLNALENP